ncbi:unnamed protein product [Thlaspi arvense]|uniref:Conserved oligomeric Golgi complex subunit 2 n=1 Tax=Thlaspi arvense TaxID=13288 RepID=A0AAU9SMH7_THLAR|nr:unnamed protein product [Thlaspi arvense]
MFISSSISVITSGFPHRAPRSASVFFSDPYDSHPLWFKPSFFPSPGFDSESFISELRTFVAFDTLRYELRSHLASLNRELVDLINRDYADFVNLSAKLVDIDSTVVRMRAPHLDLREKINGFRGSVEDAISGVRSELRQRSNAADAGEVLELLLDAFHGVSKVEKLIKVLPSTPFDSMGRSCMSDENPKQQDGTAMRETQSTLLERIACEMNRLKFYMAHAQVSIVHLLHHNLPFIEKMEKRIQSASVLLDASLGHCFIDGLNNSDTSVLYNCLRAYAATNNTKNAEEIFHTTIVAPFTHKIIARETSAGAAGTSGDIKHFIAKDCKMLLEVSSTEKSGLHVFNFLANSILKEVLSAIQKVKPGAFSPGRPTEFLKNYKASLDFLAYLEGRVTDLTSFSELDRMAYQLSHVTCAFCEGYCPSSSAVTNFRAEAIYVEFMKQWNVGVYFSLRFQEIAGSLDSALTSASLDSDSDKKSSPNLIIRQSVTLLECLRSCWKEDILVFCAADKFLRLTFQHLSRYCNWVLSAVNARKSNGGSLSPGCEWAVSATAEDFVYVIHDVNCLLSEVRGDYVEHISHYLSPCSSEVLDMVRKSMLQGAESLQNVLALLNKTIIEVIVDKSVEHLRQLKGITTTLMMNKPLPVRHSPYAVGLLRPLKAFLEGDKVTHYLTHETREELLLCTLTEITKQYYELAAKHVSEEKIKETLLQKHRQNAQKRASAASCVSDHNETGTDKMCMQLFLDLQEYGRNISVFGLNPEDIPSYCSPLAMRYTCG